MKKFLILIWDSIVEAKMRQAKLDIRYRNY